LLHHRRTNLDIHAHLSFTLEAGAEAKGQSRKQYDLFHEALFCGDIATGVPIFKTVRDPSLISKNLYACRH
jgi:hypothetical protein